MIIIYYLLFYRWITIPSSTIQKINY